MTSVVIEESRVKQVIALCPWGHPPRSPPAMSTLTHFVLVGGHLRCAEVCYCPSRWWMGPEGSAKIVGSQN